MNAKPPMDLHMIPDPDIAVIGGGNAALCAAISAAERGARVLILEAAPKPYRGGNSRHTRNFRCMHTGPIGPLTGSYGEEEYLADLLKVTEGKTDRDLARMAIRSSEGCMAWMEARGVRFQPSLSGTLSLARTNAFFLGGGKGLVNAYYRTAGSLGVDVLYDAPVTHLALDGNRVIRIEFCLAGKTKSLAPKAVIVASGGFQADIDWLARAWGSCGGKLSDPRHAVQPRRGACRPAEPGRRAGRRSNTVPCCGDRRQGAEI